jgi:hypothetical protein
MIASGMGLGLGIMIHKFAVGGLSWLHDRRSSWR